MKHEQQSRRRRWTPRRQHWASLWMSVGLLGFLFAAHALPALGAPTGGSWHGEWSTYLSYNGRSGFNGYESALNPKTIGSMKVHWMAHAGGAISAQPVEANGMVYWGSWDGFEHATDVHGKQVWARYLGRTSTCGSSAGVASTATITTLPIHGKTTAVLVVGGGDASLYVLEASTGKVIWKAPLGASPSHFLWSSPAVYQGSIYIGVASFGDCPSVQGKLLELSMATGNIEHTFNVVPQGCLGGGVWSAPTIDPGTSRVYLATGSPDACGTSERYVNALVELRASDLGLVDSWQVPRSEWVFDSDFGATPTLFTAKRGGVLRPMVGAVNKNGTYYALEQGALRKGPVWRATIARGGTNPDLGDGSISSSAWDGSRLYVAGGNTSIAGKSCAGSVRALNIVTGSVLWERCLTSREVLGAVTAVPGVVVVGAGTLVMAFAAATGKTLFVYQDSRHGSSFEAACSISRGVLYVGNFDGNLYAFGL
jgi:polyvinyl alcohol dehydrogenase (cytochrome)